MYARTLYIWALVSSCVSIFICSLTYMLMQLLTYAVTHLCSYSLIQLLTYTVTHLYSYSLMQLLTHAVTYSCSYSLIQLHVSK